MTPAEFISIWKNNPLSEKSGAQAHFEDLCRLLQVEPPRQGNDYCYEQGLAKTLGGQGFADVWKRGCFAWENKGPEKDLRPALMQLKNYAGALDNPPVLVVCNRDRIELHPCFTGYPSQPRVIALEDIGRPENLQALRWLFSPADVQKLRPHKSNAAITAEAAGEFAKIAKLMRERGLDSQQVAHFLIQCIFCMYAEDEGLLHLGHAENPAIFSGLLRSARGDPDRARKRLADLFTAMRGPKGAYGDNDIAWFNGGLFKVINIPPLTDADLQALADAAQTLDWRSIDPTIFGTLFERGLNPESRAPLGAHYTDTATIDKLIGPLIREPLRAEWESAKAVVAAGAHKGKRSDAYKIAVAAYQAFLERLRKFRVLDPACGSGNFLYLAMRTLKDLEHRAQVDAELLGLPAQLSVEAGPANVLGIEINEYAAELARVTVWIGDLQWCHENGRPIARDPILRPLNGIERRDALMNDDGTEAQWPQADVVVGNPPFLGDKMMRGSLGDAYVDRLRKLFGGRVPGGADLVTYWFSKAAEQIKSQLARHAGFVATNSIRGGANRKVLDMIVSDLRIVLAWADEPWVNEGAAVRVSLAAFCRISDTEVAPSLDGLPVRIIHADLTAAVGLDLTTARRLFENTGAAFIGGMKKGAFDIPGATARRWLASRGNPNGRRNSDVLKPWVNGLDITRRTTDTWIVDFGSSMAEGDASAFEQPFEHVQTQVLPARAQSNSELERSRWWLHARPAPELRRAISGLHRFIGTARVAKHRLFVWIAPPVVCDGQVVVIARSDDCTFGILHSRFHELWSLRLGTSLEDRPRYTPTSTFETFPFPAGLTPKDTASGAPDTPEANAIAAAATHLVKLRENWLNPADLVDWVRTPEEEQAGFPLRAVPKAGQEAELKKRTLTNLYNTRPAWLRLAHEALDKAVAAAYGWTDYSPAWPDEDILRRLLLLNHARSATSTAQPKPGATEQAPADADEERS